MRRLRVAEETGRIDKPGFDATAYWARTGLMDLVRTPGNEPALSAAGMGNHPSAMALFSGIVLALYRREKTKKGGKVSSSLLANGAWANSCMIASMLAGCPPFEGIRRDDPSERVNQSIPDARRALDTADSDPARQRLALFRRSPGPPRVAGRCVLRRSPRTA